MSEKLYAKRNVIALGEHYTRHVSAMTGEGLHDKSSIAAELAWRDHCIAYLEDRVEACSMRNETDCDRIFDLEAALREAIDYADEMESTDGDPRWTNPDLMAALRAILNQDQPTPDHT